MRLLRKSELPLLLGFLFLFVFLIVDFSVVNGYFDGFDSDVNDFVTYQSGSLVFSFFIGLTNLASTSVILVLSFILLLFLIYKKRYKEVLFFVFVLGGAAALEFIVKNLIHRSRPLSGLVDATGYSFPSGHALKAVLFFSLIIYLFLRNFKSNFNKGVFVFVCVILTLLIGFSRVYLHVHWVSDVFGGFLLGLFWFFFSLFVFERFWK